jgi:hypothetical protein
MNSPGIPSDLLRPSAGPIARALALSLALHVALFGVLELGRVLHLPEWLRDALNISRQIAEEQTRPRPMAQDAPTLTFVEVDPSQATAEAPKDTKNYSAFNSVAANPEVSVESDKIKIDGKQDKVPKVVDTLRPAPTPPLTPVKPEPQPPKPEPETGSAQKPGDLAFAKPAEPKEEEKPKRPRTLIEAQLQKGLIPGQKMRQDGGVRRHGNVTLDAKATPFGAYDAAMIDAIARRWYAILDSSLTPTRPGKVVVEFRQYSDGRVTDLKVLESNVGDVLAFYCQKAISDPSPYEKWPADMRRTSAKDFRDIVFTFYYEF